MTSTFLNPPELSAPTGFSHVAVCSPGRQVFISGQVAYNGERQLVGEGDIGVQTRQVMRNLEACLKVAGAGFADVVKLTFFVVGLDSATMAEIRRVRREFLAETNLPAMTMVGVVALARPELLLEVEAVAALKD